MEDHAREKLGMPPEWHAFKFEKIGNYPNYLCSAVTGAVVTTMFQSGPRKDRPNWKTRDKGTERTAYLTPDEHDAWKAAWEARTGKCSRCEGKGQLPQSWSREEGAKYRPCEACGGSGVTVAKAQPAKTETEPS